MPGEFEFLNWVRSQQRRDVIVQLPAGDDLAILRWPADDLLLVGIDQVLDGVHFDSTIHTPHAIGAKVMNRNLSDCAAMACLPVVAVITFALPRSVSPEYAKNLYAGIRDAGMAIASEDVSACAIVGGDTGVWNGPLAITCAILGRAAGITPIQRNGARPGDGVFVTGAIGGSILGRHMTFSPRVALARQLAASCTISAMIDLSDGLSRDLGHICDESSVGAVIDAAQIPIHPDARALCNDRALGGDRSPLEHALHDGEDYELLFTSPDCRDARAIRIGTIAAQREVLLRLDGADKPMRPAGFEHQLSSEKPAP
jgi:thiamine-monophosphate kinase